MQSSILRRAGYADIDPSPTQKCATWRPLLVPIPDQEQTQPLRQPTKSLDTQATLHSAAILSYSTDETNKKELLLRLQNQISSMGLGDDPAGDGNVFHPSQQIFRVQQKFILGTAVMQGLTDGLPIFAPEREVISAIWRIYKQDQPGQGVEEVVVAIKELGESGSLMAANNSSDEKIRFVQHLSGPPLRTENLVGIEKTIRKQAAIENTKLETSGRLHLMDLQ